MPKKQNKTPQMNPTDNFQINCICHNNYKPKTNNQMSLCQLCNKFQHKACIKSLRSMDRYICPFCQFSKSDLFINTITYILSPSLIKYQYQPSQASSFAFLFNLEQLKSHCKGGGRPESFFIVFRCLRLNSTGFCFEWPMNTVISINDKPALQTRATVTSTHLEKKAIVFSWSSHIDDIVKTLPNKHYPYDNTIHQVGSFLSNMRNNLIEVHIKKRNDDDSFNYVLAGELIEVMDDAKSIENIRLINDKQMLIAYMNEFNESKQNNTVDFLKEEVSLIDVYSGCTRIEIPARGFNCQHLGVFDVRSFISLNKKNRMYRCPICRKNSRLLYVDGIIKEMMKEHVNEDKLNLKSDYTLCSVEDVDKDKDKAMEVDELSESSKEIEDINASKGTQIIQLPLLSKTVEGEAIQLINEEQRRTELIPQPIDDDEEAEDEEECEEEREEAEKEEDNVEDENELINDKEVICPFEEENIKFPFIDLDLTEEMLKLKNEALSMQLCKNTNLSQFVYYEHLKNIFGISPAK